MTAAADQLAEETGRVAEALAMIQDAQWTVGVLTDSDDAAAATVIAYLIRALHPDGDPFPEWWRSPLGLAVARRVGRKETVDNPSLLRTMYGLVPDPWGRGEAAAVLNVSVGSVASLLDRGTLARDPSADGVHRAVSRASVLAYLAARRSRVRGTAVAGA